MPVNIICARGLGQLIKLGRNVDGGWRRSSSSLRCRLSSGRRLICLGRGAEDPRDNASENAHPLSFPVEDRAAAPRRAANVRDQTAELLSQFPSA